VTPLAGGQNFSSAVKSHRIPADPESMSDEATTQDYKPPMFGARKAARDLHEQLTAATERASTAEASLEALGGLEHAEVMAEVAKARQTLVRLQGEALIAQAGLDTARSRIVATEETEVLQEVGVYNYRHPLTDAVGFQVQLKALQARIKEMAKADGGAVLGATDWTVNGSAAEGRRMVRETGKLMLRAYNAEADNLVRSLKPYKLDSALNRLEKTAGVITKLGKTMSVAINPSYHRLRLDELALTADYLARKDEEKERERAERERLREEAKVQAEMERERKRLEKEQAHYRNALAKLEATGDLEAIERLRLQLEEIDHAIEDVDFRAANVRAGYVYVISNIGSFGEDVVKIGLTRRLDPLDRVRELGDASVPFRYDVHALFFAKDAVTIENELHQRFADQRINLVNARREFFRVTPLQVRTAMEELAGDLLEFTDVPEALEYRQSQSVAAGV
jgi:hypothetical protein